MVDELNLELSEAAIDVILSFIMGMEENGFDDSSEAAA